MVELTQDAKVACRTPAKGREGITHIPAWKFEAVRDAILAAVPDEGIGFSDLRTQARTQMQADTLAALGSWGWHFTTVKLELEVRGELARRSPTGAQWIIRGS